MINKLTIIYFLLFIFFSHLSIIGFGNIIKKNFKFSYYPEEKYFEKLIEFFLGIIFLTIVGFILYIFSIKNYYVNLSILLLGLVVYTLNRNLDSKRIEARTFLFLIIMFVGILISKTHEDYIPYHFTYIDIIANSNFILGLGNLEVNYNYTSFISYLQKIFMIPIFEYKLLHVPIFLIFFNICLFLILEIMDKKKFSIINLLLLLFFLTKFSRLSEYGYDYTAGFVLLTIIVVFYFTRTKLIKSNPSFILLLFLYAVSIKITSLFFFPLFLLIYYYSFSEIKNDFFVYIQQNIRNIIPSFILLLLMIFDNFSKTGCFFYFIEFTCAEKNIIPWAVDYNEISEFSLKVNLWAKGYFHQTIIENNPNLFLEIQNWLPIWYENYFYYKISEFIILLLFITSLIFLSNFKNFTKTPNPFNQTQIMILIASILSLIFWIVYLPQLRFGFYTILCSYIFLISLIFNLEKEYNKNNYTYLLIIIALAFYMGNNSKRIKNEFDRNDRYKFINFPFESRTNYATKKSFSKRYENRIKTNKYLIFNYISK